MTERNITERNGASGSSVPASAARPSGSQPSEPATGPSTRPLHGPRSARMTVVHSFHHFWEWLSGKTIAGWVALLVSAIMAFSHYESESKAQEVRVIEFKKVAEDGMLDLRRDLEREQESFQGLVIKSLSRIEEKQESIESEVKQVKTDMTDLTIDLNKVCDRVKANCKR